MPAQAGREGPSTWADSLLVCALAGSHIHARGVSVVQSARVRTEQCKGIGRAWWSRLRSIVTGNQFAELFVRFLRKMTIPRSWTIMNRMVETYA